MPVKCNVGNTDRIVRFIVGILLLLWAFLGLSGTGAWIAGIVGVILIATAWIKFCPLYVIFGLSTCETSKS